MNKPKEISFNLKKMTLAEIRETTADISVEIALEKHPELAIERNGPPVPMPRHSGSLIIPVKVGYKGFLERVDGTVTARHPSHDHGVTTVEADLSKLTERSLTA